MEPPVSTTLVVVGDEASQAIRSLERFPNVQAASLADAKPMGVASVVASGTDVTLVTYGALVQTARISQVVAGQRMLGRGQRGIHAELVTKVNHSGGDCTIELGEQLE